MVMPGLLGILTRINTQIPSDNKSFVNIYILSDEESDQKSDMMAQLVTILFYSVMGSLLSAFLN